MKNSQLPTTPYELTAPPLGAFLVPTSIQQIYLSGYATFRMQNSHRENFGEDLAGILISISSLVRGMEARSTLIWTELSKELRDPGDPSIIDIGISRN